MLREALGLFVYSHFKATELIIHGRNVKVGRIPIRRRGSSVRGEEILHFTLGTIVHEFPLAEENDVINCISDETVRLVNGQDTMRWLALEYAKRKLLEESKAGKVDKHLLYDALETIQMRHFYCLS